MASIQPFTISVPDADIQLLKQKLSLSRFPDEPEDAGWSQGAPLDKIKSLAEHWEHSFDWRKAEADLNTLPQFITKIEAEGKYGELDLHFVHAKSKVEGAIPLLFVHGCAYSLSPSFPLPSLSLCATPDVARNYGVGGDKSDVTKHEG